ncbi:hypothetical protein DMH04_25580 [Kibdelosporangium aridum]|uniref:Uncharacterized protein n=1 Tax=Kibdelosporangium aridum TaxID=2030 RepID=A0A428Z641_KIBAR|nr:hypothetical protein [Kibdelosporangium aridum]RSM82566.1 hypothetical protein DMH04_25580 [Kibdelosporangium aridum]
MDDGELALVARLSFVRSDLEQFVFQVLGAMDAQLYVTAWPESEAELGHQLVALGRALEWHAAMRAVSAVDTLPPDHV